MTRLRSQLFFLVLFCSTVAAPAHAERRVALVVGNGAYQKVGKLSNPANDAAAIAAMLRNANFDEVKSYHDLGVREMRQVISEFARIARNADTAVVYYSGHGMEIDGANYFIPIDAVLESDEDVPYETYSLDNLLKALEPVSRLRLVMLDACRDNPFLKTMRRTTRDVGRGLAVIEPTRLNTLIAYAAKAGSYALDGDSANSPYATALLEYLPTPGLDLRIAFGSVRDAVLAATKDKQEPWLYGSLGGGTLSLVSASRGAAPGGAAPGERADAPTAAPSRVVVAQFCREVANNPSLAVVQSLAEAYKGTDMGLCAAARADELKSQIAKAVPIPVPPQQNVVPAPPAQVQENLPKSASIEDLPGSKWDGTADSKIFELEFRADHTLHYHTDTGWWSAATWSQSGNIVHLDMNNGYATYDGKMDGNRIQGTAKNKVGHSWTWSVTKR